jgi:integrase
VDLTKGVIQIGRSLVEAAGVVTEKDTKTHQVRRVSVDATTKELLSEYHSKVLTLCVDAGGHLPDNSFVFSHDPEGRTPWRPGYVTAAFCRLRNELGMRSLRLHDLRHASASFLLAGGVDVKTVSVRLGHAQTSTTLDIYAHMINQADDRAASMLGAFLDEKG